MKKPEIARKNWFDAGGVAYAQFRPEYPEELASYLASIAPDRILAVDVGCGTGQLTHQLAMHFDSVIGLDSSEDQLAHAARQENITYQCAPAEKLPVAERSASLITAAQAAHWFDLPAFYEEVRRVAKPEAILVLISYGVLRLEGDLAVRFEHFYREEVGPFWPQERHMVDNGYAGLDFPFVELPAPALSIQKRWNLEELLGYISTWSAVRSAREAGREALLNDFAADMTSLWGDPETRRWLSWPISMRVGRLHIG